MFKPQTLSMAVFAGALALSGCQSAQPLSQNSDNKTEIKSDAEEMATVKHTDLSHYEWRLLSATDDSNHPVTALNAIKDQVGVQFNQQQGHHSIYFSVGCNSMGGTYTLKNNVLDIGAVMSTEMMCEDDINTAERLLAQAMQGSSQLSYKKDGMPLLTQITDNGYTLVWQGSKTAEARYKQKGDTVFWRIDHSEQPCPDGTTKACLNVKPVTYDERGIKTGEGEWELFVGEIEGYTHDSTQDTIVRLKRFTVDPVDVKGKQFVYVFDQVVESSVVKD